MRRFLRFFKYLKPFTKGIILLFITILVTVLINIPIPLLEKTIIDEAIPNADIHLLFVKVATILGLYAILHSFGYIRNKMSIRIRQKVLTRVRMDIYEHLQRMSMQYFSKQQSGALLSRILYDVGYIQNLVNDEFFTVVSSMIKVVVVIFLLFKISTFLSLLCLGVLPFFILVFVLFKKRVYLDNKELQETQAYLSGKIQENLSLMKLIQAETIEDQKGEETLSYNKDLERISIRRGMTSITGNYIVSMISYLPIFLILWGVGGYLAIQRVLTIGSLLAFMQYLFGVIGPVTGFFRFNMNLQAGYAALDRIYEILDKPIEIKDKPEARDFTEPISTITFKDVVLRFPDRNNSQKMVTALNHIELEIKSGEKVGIVGPSGGGKTSLIHLILRFYNPSEGMVFINDLLIDTYKIKSIRERIAYVPQEVFLFNDTIRNNITFGKEFSHQEVENAIKFAHLDELVSTMENGLDSVIGERGVTLSGGQRQRLAMARIFLKEPDLFIFDEAFSALDSKSESLIQETLKEIIKGRTAIIIAHRFSFLELVDRILVISEGSLVEDGHFDELLKRKGLFYKLYETQKLEHV
jgi:ABC-type multidrug transport system fused ATPase/permease subunit